MLDRRWILGGVLFASGVGLARILTARPKLDEDSRVLVIGDSMGVGMAPHLRGLALEADIPLASIAKVGTRVDNWADSQLLVESILEFEPTHVFVSLGTNDAYTVRHPSEVADDAKELVELIEEADAHVIWIGAPNLPVISNGHAIDEAILVAIKDAVPNYFDSTNLDIPRSPDRLHPTAAGYAGWAGALWNWLT